MVRFLTSYISRRTRKKKINFRHCYFIIKPVPLVAIIVGGFERYVSNKHPVTIDASVSFDPNVDGPHNREGLEFHWNCVLVGNGAPCNFLPQGFYSSFLLTPQNLTTGSQYNITLVLKKKGLEDAYAYQLLTAGSVDMTMTLSCLSCEQNSIANPREYIKIKLKITGEDGVEKTNLDQLNISWKYWIEGSEPIDANSIRTDLTSIDMFVIEPLTLMDAKSYFFEASIKDSPVKACLQIHTPYLNGANCSTTPPCQSYTVSDPEKAEPCIAGVTLIDIKCVMHRTPGESVIFEFFDKNETDNNSMFRGRMLGTNMKGELNKVRVTRGHNISVFVYEEYGKMATEISFRLNMIMPYNESVDFIDELIKKVTQYFQENNYHYALQTASTVADLVTPEMNRFHNIEKLLIVISEEMKINTMEELKIYLSTVSQILIRLNERIKGNNTELVLNPSVAKRTAYMLHTLTHEFLKRVKNIHYERTLSQSVVGDMTSVLYDSIEVLFEEQNLAVKRATYLEYINPKLLAMVQDTSYQLIHILEIIAYTSLQAQLPGDRFSEVHSLNYRIFSWVKTGSPAAMYNLTLTTKHFPFVVSLELVKAIEKLTPILGFMFMVLQTDAYWWARDDTNTNLLLVNFCLKTKSNACLPGSVFEAPIYMFFNITNALKKIVPINGTTHKVDPSTNEFELDEALTVYRFDPPLRAKLFVKFMFDTPPGSEIKREFKVLIKANERPLYEDVVNFGVNISRASPVYNIRYELNDIDKFYYMAIIPTNRMEDGPIDFKMFVYHTLCKSWLRWQWSSRGCWVGDRTENYVLECGCVHLSVFAGSVVVPQYDLNPFKGYRLFLTPYENILPSLLFLGVFLIYFPLLLLAIFWDRKDKKKVNVIVLEDNYPADRVAYLLGVYTGSRFKAGTTANVAIRLYGEDYDSRPHILKSSFRRTLTTNSDDWFLMYTPVHLGTLTTIHLWHDNTGSSPDWFIEKVVVFDLSEKKMYIFLLDIWLSLEIDDSPEILVYPADLEEFFSIKNTFLTNLVNGFKDNNIWTSVLWKHPRNLIPRKQRVHVMLCFVLLAMSTSLLLFHWRFKNCSDEDEPSYTIDVKDITILLITLLITHITASVIMLLFRKSFSNKYIRRKSTVYLRYSNVKSELYSVYSQYNKVGRTDVYEGFIRYGLLSKTRQERTLFLNFAAAIFVLVRGSPLIPVKLPQYKSGVVRNLIIEIIAWAACLFVISISVLILLLSGWGLEYVRGLKWATILSAVIAIDFFIVSPLKVLLCSLFLALMYQRMVQIDTYNVNPSDGIQKELKGSIRLLYNLFNIRSQVMYCPLSVKMKEIYRNQKLNKIQWKRVIHFSILVLLIFILKMVVGVFIADSFENNAHSRLVITSTHNPNIPKFEEVFNRTDFEDFLLLSFLHQLYRYMWYNHEPLINLETIHERRKDYTNDCVSRLLGNARIRQLRVVEGKCSGVSLMQQLREDCSPKLDGSTEDTDTYNIRWATGGYTDTRRLSSAWRYTQKSNSNSSHYYGKTSTLYHAGGYIGDMGSTRKSTQLVLSNLVKDVWLDHMTRAVFVELTLYNANTRFFNQVILIIEQVQTGEYLPYVNVESVRSDVNLNFWYSFFILFILLLFLRMCLQINRKGLLLYLSTFLLMFELVLLIIGILIVIVYIIHTVASSIYIQQFKTSGLDSFFSFFKIQYYSNLCRSLLSVLYALMIVRLLMSFHFGKNYVDFYYTFLLSLSWIVNISFLFILYFVITWRFLGYLTSNFIFPYYSRIISPPNSFRNYRYNEPIGYYVILYILCFISNFLMALLTAAFVYYYCVAKAYKLLDSDPFSYIEFLKDKLKKRRNND